MAKDTRIAFRASKDLKDRLQRASKKVKLGETALAEAAVEAAVEYIETHGGIWLPLRVVPEVKVFSEAGEKRGADAGGPSTPSTRIPASAAALPKATRTGIEKTTGRKRGKSAS